MREGTRGVQRAKQRLINEMDDLIGNDIEILLGSK